MSNNTNNKEIAISDMYLAVYLKTKFGLHIKDLKKSAGRVVFQFTANGLSQDDLMHSYYSGDDTVSANAFVKELKDMKSLVHNITRKS
jgi:hypothetical protein